MPPSDPTEIPPPPAADPVFGPAPTDPRHGAYVHAAPPAAPGRGVAPVLSAIGFVLLVIGLAVLWNQQQTLRQQLAEQAQRPTVDPGQLAALGAQIKALEQRPAPVADTGKIDALAASVTKLSQQVAVLEQRPAPAADTGKVDAVSADVARLGEQVAALAARKPPTPPDPAAVVAPLAQKLDSVVAESAANKTAETEAAAQLAAVRTRLKDAEQQAAAAAAKAAQAGYVARAQAALAAGEPLGDLPGAPPALARFAKTRPPTEAALRLSYPAAADAAEDASRPSTKGLDLGQRMWLRARTLVTVKQGDTVLVGPPAATILGAAHEKLEAGDLAGAVAELDRLDGAAAAAMAGWRTQARALLDARAALTEMARA
jgi:hypothetical protein